MRLPLFVVKWTNYEYWPWWFFYLPMMPYWLFLAMKTKSFTFFTATNTNMELGGFFGESKIDILRQIPATYLPLSHYIKTGTSWEQVQREIQEARLSFPLVAKPNIGERGFQVEKLQEMAQLEAYHSGVSQDYIVQEFLTYPIELGVLYCRLPNDVKGKVTSVTIKEFLKVKGDGSSSIAQLMQQSDRARFQMEAVSVRWKGTIDRVLAKDEEMVLEPIGNHCRGTRFVSGQHLIQEPIHDVFDRIVADMEGFHYGRFDLKVRSLEDLYQGEHIRIMELNGASSEPGHIYDTSRGLFRAYKDLAYHWDLLAAIALQNRARKIEPVSFKKALSTFLHHFGIA